MTKVIKISTEGTTELIEIDSIVPGAGKAINADMIEIVRCLNAMAGANEKLVFVVDESGALKDHKKINSFATAIYGDYIFGDILVMAEVMTDDGPDLAGLENVAFTTEDGTSATLEQFVEETQSFVGFVALQMLLVEALSSTDYELKM